jgi:predicted ester cyclase/catechol 2,3-dioxygenase-like lactoylglutathione lyase family enzyme
MSKTTEGPQPATVVAESGDELLAGINHVAIVTGDLARLETFYERAFDASVIRRWDGEQRHSMIRLGPTTVLHAFERTDDLGSSATPFQRGRLDHMGINAASGDAFDRLRERLVHLGASDGSVTEFPMISSVRFVDPDGMEVELCWQGPDRQFTCSRSAVMAADQVGPGLSNGDVVRRFYDDWNRGEIDFDELVDEDIVNHQPEAVPERGRSRFAEAVRGVMAAVPDSRWTISDLLADGDRVVVRITWTGTYGGSQFRGLSVAASGEFSVEHIHVYRVEALRLAEHWVVRDDLAMMRQLGAVPA